jgi:diacylglycerol kinase (ATP)
MNASRMAAPRTQAMESDIHVIFNPIAGQHQAARLAPAMQDKVANSDRMRWLPTARPGDAYRLAAAAVQAGAATVVAAGGDGTVNEIINGLMAAADGRPLPVLAILPVGSANDIALALGITGIENSLAHLGNGVRRRIDVGQVTSSSGWSHYFCMSAGVGIVAAIAEERNRIHRLRGSTLYFAAALRTFTQPLRMLDLQLGFDGETEEQVSVGALLANNSPRSGGFTLAPDADMSDGALDILALRERGRKLTTFRLVQLLLAVRAGTHLRHEEVMQHRCQQLTLTTSHPLTLQLDGELHHLPAGAASPLHIRLLPGALTIAA